MLLQRIKTIDIQSFMCLLLRTARKYSQLALSGISYRKKTFLIAIPARPEPGKSVTRSAAHA